MAGGHGQNDGMKTWLRPLVVCALLGLSAFLLYAAVNAQAEDEPPVRRAGLVQVFPKPDTVAIRQGAIGAEVDFGWSGRLSIGSRVIPDDQIDRIGGINRLTFTPGPGKEIESLDEGRHCASLLLWRTADGETTAGPAYSWCFTAA